MSAQAPGSVDNELEDINSVFRRQYANAKARALEHLQRSDIPVIIVQRTQPGGIQLTLALWNPQATS